MFLPVLLVACLPKNGSAPGETAPILPATTAPLYTSAPATPPDPFVAELIGDIPWDETLSGAAAALALGNSNTGWLDGHEVQWAAYRAGWPHPILSYAMQRTERGETPSDLVSSLAIPPGATLGLARARASSTDTWVLIVGKPLIDVAPFAREYQPGDSLKLTITDGGGWADFEFLASSPSGQLHIGNPIQFEENGEWVVEIQGLRGEGRSDLLRAPIYVGVPVPVTPPIEERRPITHDEAEILELALDGIKEIRDIVGVSRVHPEPMLQASARKALAEWMSGQAISDPQARMASLGYPNAAVAEVRCHAVSVNACLDDLYWSVDTRPQFLDNQYSNVGVAAGLLRGNVVLVVDLASE